MNSITFSRTIEVPYEMCERCAMFEPERSKFFNIDTKRRADDIGCGHEQTCKELVRTIVENGLVDADGTNYKISATQPKSNHEADKEQENAVMTPKSFLWMVEKFIADELHPEDFHVQTDELMEKLLTSLGYGEGIKAIQSQIRWYA